MDRRVGLGGRSGQIELSIWLGGVFCCRIDGLCNGDCRGDCVGDSGGVTSTYWVLARLSVLLEEVGDGGVCGLDRSMLAYF